MRKTEKDYEDLLRLFNKHKVKYCLVGAYALAFHAVPRYTKDMDFFVEGSPDNAKRILKALREFGFSSLKIKERDFCELGKIIQLGYEPLRADILTSIDGCTFEEVWRNKRRGLYGRQKVYFMGLSDLVKNKKASGRKQDQADLDILMKKRSA
ncbi:MAG: nucleotidyl transferase AbiEii/AbiGii toxin family protein [Candidatus Omnitrophica bacterium]|nr:nucleotidyl transferase AbiEii/AbiGii toxin family protein [Candidatus Omnitrophota bacterium]